MTIAEWKTQPGIVVTTFGKVRIILARVFSKVDEWNVLVIGVLGNPRETLNGSNPEEVITRVKERFNI